MSSEDSESLKTTVNEIINEKKLKGTWDPCHWQITLALIASLRLPDTSIANILKDQGADLSPRSLLSFVNKGSAKLLRFVIRELQKAGTWRPDDWHTGLALAESWFYERKKLYTVFAENGVVFMPEWLVTAVKYGDIGLIVKLVHGLKATGHWDSSNPFIVNALSEAIKEEANIWYYCLLEEGAVPHPEHLTTAVRRGDITILRDIIQKLKVQGIWKTDKSVRHIMFALEEACMKRDITAYSTLIEEGAEPDFHSLLIAVKSDYYQLAARIVRDLKLCGKWNEKVLKIDWSLALARDHITNMPNGNRQKWEHLLFGSGRVGVPTSTETKDLAEDYHENTNTDIKQLLDCCLIAQNADSEKDETNEDGPKAPTNTQVAWPDDANTVDEIMEESNEDDLYPYEEPTDEALYRNLQRSVSAPVADNEYPSREGRMDQEKSRKRHPTEPRDLIPSDGDSVIFLPGIGDETIARSSGYRFTDAIYDGDDDIHNTGEMYHDGVNRHETSNQEVDSAIEDINTFAREPILSGMQAFRFDENEMGDSIPPCRPPGVLDHLLQRLTRPSTQTVSPNVGSTRLQRHNDIELQRLRRQFSFSIRSIPLTVSYADHLRYITKLQF